MAKAVRCLICANVPLRLFVDNGLNNGLSNAGIAASIVDLGGKLDPDVVGRHKANHWTKPERTEGPKPTRRDLNIMVRDKVIDAIEDYTPDALMLMGKELAPMVNSGLKAQAALDKQVQHREKLGASLWLAGFQAQLNPAPVVPELEDGDTTEGEAVEVHD